MSYIQSVTSSDDHIPKLIDHNDSARDESSLFSNHFMRHVTFFQACHTRVPILTDVIKPLFRRYDAAFSASNSFVLLPRTVALGSVANGDECSQPSQKMDEKPANTVLAVSENPEGVQWKRPDDSMHAHFDCFSGAAGDMMLASCIDAAGDIGDQLLGYVGESIRRGFPELDGEFELYRERVWRGMGSIAATKINVSSLYGHTAAPTPKLTTKTIDERDYKATEMAPHTDHDNSDPSFNQTHRHVHSHAHEQEGHSHHLEHNTSANQHSHDHEHVGEHSHVHSHEIRNSYSKDHNHASGPLRNLPQIREMLQSSSVEFIPLWVRDAAIEAFTELARAEATVHGASGKDTVYFHEVGAVDSIVDTVGTLLALHALGVESVSCSRLPLGEGTVWTDHGLLPVPAPATLLLMVGMPTSPGPPGVTGELVTPTAAALLRVLTKKDGISSIAGRPPRFVVNCVGIGAGTKNFRKHPNILRLLIGDSVVIDESTERT
jgi:hypothetical protein